MGQGWPGFWTSALSGIFVGLAPALTGNAWGGVLVQVLTNACGPSRAGERPDVQEDARARLTGIRVGHMDSHMKTTLEIDEGVMRELKRRAAEEGTTMSELVEGALRVFLRPPASAKPLPPLPTFDGGRQLMDLDSRASWLDALDGDDDARR